ncbi:MAG: ABC transporter permease [Streptosporangiaceae bacterium]
MLRTTLANLGAHKGRLLLSSLAIALGVAFVAGTLVFTGALKNAFFGAFAADVGKASVVVTSTDHGDVPSRMLDDVGKVNGVAAADGQVSGGAMLVDPRGHPLGGPAEAHVVSVPRSPDLRWEDVVRGHPPRTAGQAVLDLDTAKRAGLHVGDPVRVATGPRESRTLRLVGLSTSATPRHTRVRPSSVSRPRARRRSPGSTGTSMSPRPPLPASPTPHSVTGLTRRSGPATRCVRGTSRLASRCVTPRRRSPG